MHYNFIEIGTSDFFTILQQENPGTGLSIEPLKIYLDRLPDKEGVTKVNCAISDTDGIVDVYWIDPDDINKYNLPDWLRGCNSIINPHPTALAELAVRGISDIYKKTSCEAICWNTLIERYNVESLDHLKIDTEGHDCIILQSILKSKIKILPKTIVFENNSLTNTQLTEVTLNKLIAVGYEVFNKTPDDIYIKLI
jgi:FkbM family methyltransferase